MQKFEKNLKHLHELREINEDLLLSDTELTFSDIDYLRAAKLVDIKGYQDGNYDIYITDIGLTYFNDKRSKIKDFFLKSLFTPIIVAFITTLLINHFSPWFLNVISKLLERLM